MSADKILMFFILSLSVTKAMAIIDNRLLLGFFFYTLLGLIIFFYSSIELMLWWLTTPWNCFTNRQKITWLWKITWYKRNKSSIDQNFCNFGFKNYNFKKKNLIQLMWTKASGRFQLVIYGPQAWYFKTFSFDYI